MSPLVTLTGDGTFRAPVPQHSGSPQPGSPQPGSQQSGQLTAIEDPQLDALMRLRGLLGDDLEDQIATRLYLPMALGTDATDHLLPASLAMLSDESGDLAPYGWRIGTGLGRDWQRARDRIATLADAARIALLGYEGPLSTAVLGPATLAASTFVGSGERTLSDPGAVRDLPMLLAEGLADHLDLMAERVPGGRAELLVREDAVGAVATGLIPTPSGRRTYPAIPATVIGTLWRCLLAELIDRDVLDPDRITLGIGASRPLLQEARQAGFRRFAIAPHRLPALSSAGGRDLWEEIAGAHDAGCRIEWVLDARPGGALTAELDQILRTWQQLGFGAAQAQGFTLIGHTGSSHALHAGTTDPSEQPAYRALLDEAGLEHLLRAAPLWAERVQS